MPFKIHPPNPSRQPHREEEVVQRRGVRFYARLSDSELISFWSEAREREDVEVLSEAEAELIRRKDQDYEPKVPQRPPPESSLYRRARSK